MTHKIALLDPNEKIVGCTCGWRANVDWNVSADPILAWAEQHLAPALNKLELAASSRGADGNAWLAAGWERGADLVKLFVEDGFEAEGAHMGGGILVVVVKLREGAEAWFDEGMDAKVQWRMGLYSKAQLEDGAEGLLMELNAVAIHWEAADVFNATVPFLRYLKP